MSPPEPAISFSELFAYTDYLANWWFAYLTEHEAALALNLGGQTGTLRNLVEHIVQAEEFFASRLLGQEPAEKPENSGLADLLRTAAIHNGNIGPRVARARLFRLCRLERHQALSRDLRTG